MISSEAHYDHMRMIRDDIPCVRLLRQKRVKARVQHECKYCKQPIMPGETFKIEVWLDEDQTPNKIETVKECDACLMRDWMNE